MYPSCFKYHQFTHLWHVINHPFTTLFSSQSTDPPKPDDESYNEEGGFGGTFDDLEFDDEEENFLDHMLMSMKQFMILNKKLNSIIQSQADMGGSHSVSTLEIDGMLKAFEAKLVNKVSGSIQASEPRIMEKVDQNDQNNELWVKSQSLNFMGEVKDFKRVAKERHVLFVQDVKRFVKM